MRRSHRANLAAVAGIAVVAMVAAACGGSSGSSSSSSSGSSALTASAPGITATTITIGSHQPLTGVAAPGYDEIAPAVERLLPVRQRARRHLRPEDRLQVPERPVQPDDHLDGGAPAGAAGQRLRDLQRPRHADAPGRGAVPEQREGARRVRRLRLRVLERPEHLPGHVRLAARLRARGQDPRQVHRAALQGQEDRLLLPGRRVRPGRRQGPGLRDPEVPDRGQGELRPDQHQDRPAGRRAQGGRAPRSWSRSRCPRSPRC